MDANLACDKFWVNKNLYHDAEKKYYESLAKLQRRLEILGTQSEETSSKKLNEMKNCHKKHNIDFQSLREDLVHLEVHENIKNKISHSDFKSRNENDSYKISAVSTNSEKKKQNKKLQKELQEKNIKNEKKPKKTKENEDRSLGGVGVAKIDQDTFPKTSLAGEVAKARQHIKSSLECMESLNGVGNLSTPRLTVLLEKMEKAIENLTKRVEVLERECTTCKTSGSPPVAVNPEKSQTPAATKPKAKEEEKEEEDDDIDLFGSESEEEDEEAKKIREQRLAEYAAKKSKKPGPVAKSNIILDIKPWDDETDMKEMEKAVRAIEMDGLVWGASKLVPVAFKIFMLQISCVIEDEKVSVDLLTETLEGIEEYIQSVDIAAFNKV